MASKLRSYFSTAAGPLGGGSFDEDMPEYRGVVLDPATSGIIDQKVAQSERSDDVIARHGLEGTRQSLDQSNFGGISNSMGGYQDPAMSQAIRQRAERNFDSDLNRLQRQAAIEAPAKRADNMSLGMNSVLQKQKLDNSINQAQIQADHNKKQLRNAVISNIFSAGGTVLGIYTGGASQRAGQKNKQEYEAVSNSGKGPSMYNSGSMDQNQDYNNIA